MCFKLISDGNLVSGADWVCSKKTFNEPEPIEPDYDAEILKRSNTIRANAQSMIQYVEQLGNQMIVGKVLAVALPQVNQMVKLRTISSDICKLLLLS